MINQSQPVVIIETQNDPTLYNILKRFIGRVVSNKIQNLILPNSLSLLLSSKNQVIVGILLNKLGVATNIISVILLFL